MMEKKRMAALLAAVLFGMSAIPAGAVNRSTRTRQRPTPPSTRSLTCTACAPQ